MEQDRVNLLIAENMKKIFSFSLSRVGNTAQAEDLASNIYLELLRSCKTIRNDEAFYGFMWGVAHNVYKRFLRKKRTTVPFEEYLAGNIMQMSDEAFDDRISSLKRELSLLSSQYRECTVLYYIKNKSCLEIASTLNISAEMVKYYLFKARKLIKEGISVQREHGERSYNPDVFSMDYWGTGPSDEYWRVLKRRLPGNILLSAYYEPLTVTELSIELGVSAVYLEDELEILLSHNLLKQLRNGKYQTNIVIFTLEYEEEWYNKTKGYYKKLAKKLCCFIEENEEAIRAVGFNGSGRSKNTVYWYMVVLSLLHGYNLSQSSDDYPLLSNGSHGYVYGYNRDYSNHKFLGIECANTKSITPPSLATVNYRVFNCNHSFENYRAYRDTIIEVMQGIPPHDIEVAALLVQGGYLCSDEGFLKANFPVYTVSQFNELLELLSPITKEIASEFLQINKIAVKILSSHVPKALKERCGTLGMVISGMAAMACTVEEICGQGMLTLPKHKEIVSAFGVVEGSGC